MKNNETNKKYQIYKNENDSIYAICNECYKQNIITSLIENWKPYEEGVHQSNFYYTCPIHTEISIVTDIKLPLKKD